MIQTIPQAGIVLALIMLLSPPETISKMQSRPKTQEEIQSRVESIANNIADVVWDEHEAPLFTGSYGRELTAALLISTFQEESAFRAEVDDGAVRGDHGASWCLGQIKLQGMKIKFDPPGLYSYSFTKEGYSGSDLVTDRALCVRASLHILRNAKKSCPNSKFEESFSAYASGKCNMSKDISVRRVRKAKYLVQEAFQTSILN